MEVSDQRLHDVAAAADHDQRQAIPAPSLAGSPLFEGLAPAEVDEILSSFDHQSFNAGHRVTLEGFRGREFYLIAEGAAVVTVGDRRVAALGPGDFFGEVAVLSDGLRSATVSAETPLRCLVLSDDALERLLVAHPRVSVNMLREVVTRFSAATAKPRRPQGVLSS